MHELAITQSLLDTARQHAERADAVRVRSLNLVIGELSSFVDDSVQFYWDNISKGTICEGAELKFERVPARLRCLTCHLEYGLSSELTPCPSCAGARVTVVAGDEFRLDSIDIETTDPSESSESAAS